MSNRNGEIIKVKSPKINTRNNYPIAYQSANAFFHFMEKQSYLNEIIDNKKIYPRYCKEDLTKLNLDIKSISIAMKSFCNISLHMVSDHKKEYGSYCIGFTKEWGIRNGLQPVTYYNQESSFGKALKISYESAIKYASEDDILANISEMINYTFKYMKPVIGTDLKTQKIKDFTDEKEWRYVPDINNLDFGEVIIEASVIDNKNIIERYNKIIKNNGYYLEFEYDDIKFLFVNNDSQRKSLIKRIKKLDCTQDEINRLITRICVWSEMEGDF